MRPFAPLRVPRPLRNLSLRKPGPPPLLIPTTERRGFWLPPHICFLNPNLGVGVRFPVRAGREWPGLKDMGTRARATGPTRRQERTQAVSGVGGNTGPPVGLRGLDQSRGRGRRGAPRSRGWLPRSGPTLLPGARLAPTRGQPFPVLGAPEDFLAVPPSRPLHLCGGTRARGFGGGRCSGCGAGPQAGGRPGAAASAARAGARGGS